MNQNSNNMRKVLLIISIALSSLSISNAQCTPNPIFTMSPIPGIYPPNIPIPNIPLIGINDGNINIPYNETLTLIVLEDTTLDIGFLLDMIDPTITPLMNSAGISTTMTVDVNHVTYDVSGLPNNLTSICDISNCEYPSGTDGCIAINGTPVQSGTFPVDVSMTINIQIPAITVPIIGTVIYPGSSQDMPAFSAQQYDLVINSSSGINNLNNESILIYPNPTSDVAVLEILGEKDIKIYDNLGKLIFQEENVNSALELSKEELGIGLFIIKIVDNNKIWEEKLIIN